MAIAFALADAGLLADNPPRERYASLDQLAPGDRIVWTSSGQSQVRQVFRAIDYGDEFLLMFVEPPEHHTVNAALLVRRAER